MQGKSGVAFTQSVRCIQKYHLCLAKLNKMWSITLGLLASFKKCLMGEWGKVNRSANSSFFDYLNRTWSQVLLLLNFPNINKYILYVYKINWPKKVEAKWEMPWTKRKCKDWDCAIRDDVLQNWSQRLGAISNQITALKLFKSKFLKRNLFMTCIPFFSFSHYPLTHDLYSRKTVLIIPDMHWSMLTLKPCLLLKTFPDFCDKLGGSN